MSMADRDSTTRMAVVDPDLMPTEETLSVFVDRVLGWLSRWAWDVRSSPAELPGAVVRQLQVETGWTRDGNFPHRHDELWPELRKEVARRGRRTGLPDLLGPLERYEDALRMWGFPTIAGVFEFWPPPGDDDE